MDLNTIGTVILVITLIPVSIMAVGMAGLVILDLWGELKRAWKGDR